MDDYVENVVVGSGFGGAVAAYRLASEGHGTLVLERGKSYAPGMFPRTPRGMATNFWDPSEGRQGLFDVWSFRGFDAVVAAGLGGGSLIYSNVLIRKPEAWFVTEEPFGRESETWPVTRSDLETHYDAVEAMLDAQPFPVGRPGFENVTRAEAMREAAQGLDLKCGFPKLAVSFRSAAGADPAVGRPLSEQDYRNLHGKPRSTCTLCGECNIGCNEGSKNTLDHTYLSAAAGFGAVLRERCEVRSFRHRGEGYEVDYVEHLPEDDDGRRHDTARLKPRTIRCRRLILAAGSLGTSYLLLRMRQSGDLPGMSPALGKRYSGNGDYFAIMLRTRGPDGRPRDLHASTGPAITTAISGPEQGRDGERLRGFLVEDAGYPAAFDWLFELSRPGLYWRLATAAFDRVWGRLTGDPNTRLGGSIGRILGDGNGAESSMPLLGMGRDVPDGVMTLGGRDRAYLSVDWTTKTSRKYFSAVRSTMEGVANQLGAEKLKDTFWSFLDRTITVHPLGGAPMGANPMAGVCDGFGEVFGHPGLFVADGAAMPGPVGVNPSLTIAAFSDRMASAILDGRAGRHGTK
ncbi:GMC oxidoreductase [Amycolatopsis solani]|uniref:GMC oxidoreductase n=1 Tax=Amycolatopsis solani TaxID=3028615 RepID=UPI0025B21A43|nr:GMC oxidoreductase [Amycolatopsis sp. MEP2-6]